MWMHARTVALAAVLSTAVTGCGSSSGGSPDAGRSAAQTSITTSPAPAGPADFPPESGEIVRTIKTGLGSGPSGAATGLGSVWVVHHRDGRIIRIDPKSGRILAKIKVPRSVGHLEESPTITSAGLLYCLRDNRNTLVRIDPTTNRLSTARVNCSGETAGAVGTWVAGNGRLTRVDPATLETEETFRLPEQGGGPLTQAGGSLWVIGFDGGDVYRIDPASGRVVKHWAFGHVGYSIATDGRRVFVANPISDVVYALDVRNNQIAMQRKTAGFNEGDPVLTYGLGALWLSTNSGGLARVDPKTLQITASVQLWAQDYDGQLGIGFGRIWFPTYGGDTVLEVRPLG